VNKEIERSGTTGSGIDIACLVTYNYLQEKAGKPEKERKICIIE